MYPIIKKEKLADKIYLMDVKAERVAKSAKPGQFVIVKIDEEGERIPLTICDYDEKAGTVTMDVANAIKEIKAGKIEYRLDKANIIHCPVGKASFTAEQLNDNFNT